MATVADRRYSAKANCKWYKKRSGTTVEDGGDDAGRISFLG
jgi:hypothetical protein